MPGRRSSPSRRRPRSPAWRAAASTARSACSIPPPRSDARRCSRPRAPSTRPSSTPSAAARKLVEASRERAAEAKEREEEALEGLDLTAREAEQRVKRAARGAEREELLASLEELASWYRDLVAAAAGAEKALVHVDRAEELHEDGTLERLEGAELAAELVRETWRRFEEFQLSPTLALEALFVQLRRAFAGSIVVAA